MNEWPHSFVKHTVASRHSFSNITAWKMSERNFLKLQLKSNLLQSPDQVPHYIKQPSYFHYFISFLGPISTLKFNIIDFNAHCCDQKTLGSLRMDTHKMQRKTFMGILSFLSVSGETRRKCQSLCKAYRTGHG